LKQHRASNESDQKEERSKIGRRKR